MKKNIAFLIGLMLFGCKTPKIDKAPDSALALEKSARSILRGQEKLHQSGALHQKRPHFTSSIIREDQRVNIDWQGDALELLAQLAHQRGIRFAYSGIRCPLPVNISTHFIRFDDLLRQIDTQISWRAVLKRSDHRLHLYFSLPEKAGQT